MRLGKPAVFAAVAALVGWGWVEAATGPAPTLPTPAGPVPMLSPADELATIQLPPGFHLELVASEPDVISPVLCVWDGDGRMYVAELRSYMLDINGSRAHTPISRVSRWESTRGDGAYDRHTAFADNLILPRMVLPLDDRVLIRLTDTKDVVSYRDTKRDGVADEVKTVYAGGKQDGNLEHQPSGLVWDLDNWIYVTAQWERFRFTGGMMQKSPLKCGPGQWGLAMTDTGQLIFNSAGGENPATNFQVMPHYGNVCLGGEQAKGFEAIHPIEHLTDVEGGVTRLWPEGGLNHFSGCCGATIYRGNALPADLYGDYMIPEPVGRLIRRAKVTSEGGKTVISNPDDSKEFIASTDPNFRPVWAATGPDGYLYFCDMYHGIIQEANWTKEGSYLRPQIQKYALQKNINRGRIWRLVYDGSKPHAPPHMLEETTAQLVRHLSDSNGWWRDTAQKLIVLRQDQSVVPALTAMAAGDPSPLGRLHALWTLDGLSASTDAIVEKAATDADPRVRAAAVRVAEPRIKTDPALAATLRSLASDPDPAVAKQVTVTALFVDSPDAKSVVAAASANHPVAADVARAWQENVEKAIAEQKKADQMAAMDKAKGEQFVRGRDIYRQTCIACHGSDGNGAPVPGKPGQTLAPPLKHSIKLIRDRQVVGRIVLRGLTGPDDGRQYPGQMAGFPWADDGFVAAVLTYARNDFGNDAPAVSADDVAVVRKLTSDRVKPYTQAELYAEAQSTAGVTPTGARVDFSPGQVTFDPSDVEIHGALQVECYAGGLDVGFWNSPDDWVSWSARSVPAGEYDVVCRAGTPDGPVDAVVSVGDKSLPARVPKTADWQSFEDVPLGRVRLDGKGPVVVAFKPAKDQVWHSMNLASVRLVPVGVR